jgi:hypothetical protein
MCERAGSDISITISDRAAFEREVCGCFGVMPNFFYSSAAPGLTHPKSRVGYRAGHTLGAGKA